MLKYFSKYPVSLNFYYQIRMFRRLLNIILTHISICGFTNKYYNSLNIVL